uniref:Alpha 1,4-glycosyltransferase domain-containing protein n=1 Tax=Fagus sylvatica TaxID=28930 RepID=A0A2N9FAJ1_FAGSY
MTKNMFDSQVLSRAKLPILFTFTLFAMIFVIYIDSIIYEHSFHSFEFRNNGIPEVVLKSDERIQGQLRSSIGNNKQLRVIKEEIEEVEDENWKALVPPLSVTEQERIAWFREKMPKFHIFKSNNLTQLFHNRVMEFFDSGCEARFFMTWLSPAASFGRREFFTLESLFKAHPHGCLMILSRSLDSGRGYRILKPLVDKGFRVNAVSPDLAFLFKNTPAEAWFKEMKSGNKDPGEIPLAQNLSNLMRLAILYKYGGVYLDTDFIVLKPFTGLKNSIGAQSIDAESKNWTRLNNAVLIFDVNHPLLLKFMMEFALTFDGNKWGHNGPYLVSRVVENIRNRPGYNFTVLQPMAFYPVDWIRIGRLFNKPANRGDSKWVQTKLLQLSRESYGVHLWNKQTRNLRIEEGSVMGKLILEHCLFCKHIYSS